MALRQLNATVIGFIVAAIIIIALLIRGFYFTPLPTPPATTLSHAPSPTVHADPYTSHTAPTYENAEYGFRLQLPASWEIYKTRIDKVSIPEHTLIWFALPLQKRLTLNGRSYDVWYLDITPLASWQPNRCAQQPEPCYQGPELGRSAQYVFEAGVVAITPAEKCADSAYSADEAYFCRVSSDAQQLQQPTLQLR